MAGFIDVTAGDGGQFQAWLAEPQDWQPGKHGAIVFLAEAYNVNQWARQAAQRYADAGYLVVAPDLYWRQKPGVYLEYNKESQGVGRTLYGKMDYDAAVRDAQACMQYLRAHPASNGRVGLVGFCLGGKIVFLTAARADPDAAVGYYSIDLDEHFSETANIRCPAAFHFGAHDERVPVRYADDIRKHLQPGQRVEVIVHEAAGHGFGRFGQPTFEAQSALRAHSHTLELFQRALSPQEGAASSTREARRTAVESVMAQIVGLLQAGKPDRARLKQISEVLQQLTRQQALFPIHEFAPPAPDSGVTSSRYLLLQDEQTRTTLYLNSIIAGKKTQPHNHGTWAVIVALEGEELNRLYRRVDDGSDPKHAQLALDREYVVKPGAPIEFMPDDIHSIHVDHGPAVRHLHLYGQPLESLGGRLGFNLETGEVVDYNRRHMRPTVASDAG